MPVSRTSRGRVDRTRLSAMEVFVISAIFLMISSAGIIVKADPPPTSICDINQLNGVAEGDLVIVEGVCTVSTGRLGHSTTIIGDPDGGAYCCGLRIYDRDELLIAARGDCVRVRGTITEYYDVIEIVLDPTFPPDVWNCEWAEPEPEELTDCDAALTPYKNCILTFRCLTIAENPDAQGYMSFTDRTGCFRSILFLHQFDPPLTAGDELCSLTGLLDYHFSEFSIRPRDENDIDRRPHADCPFCEGVCDPVGIDATMNIEAPEPITAGDPFIHQVTWKNHCVTREAILFDVLEIENVFWFWPGWTEEIDGKYITLPEFGEHAEEILNFIWPDDAPGGIHGTFHAAALDPETLLLLGDIAEVDFCTL